MEPLERKTAETSGSGTVSTKLQRIAKLAKESGPDIQTMQTKIGQLQNRVLLTTES